MYRYLIMRFFLQRTGIHPNPIRRRVAQCSVAAFSPSNILGNCNGARTGSRNIITYRSSSTFLESAANTNANANDQRPKIRLYQYAICPFCHSVKSVLNYARIRVDDYDVVEVNPLTKSEIKPWKKQHTKVPIAVLKSNENHSDEKVLFGSDVIVQALLDHPWIQKSIQSRWSTGSTDIKDDLPVEETMTWSNFCQSPTVTQWRSFASNELAVLLYPNMCRTWNDSYRAFQYVHDDKNSFSFFQRVLIQNVGSLAMYIAASRIKKKHNIADERQALEDALVKLETALRKNGPYLSGNALDHPNLGDLTVFGTLQSVEGLPIHDELINDRGGPIRDWYVRMKDQVTTM